VQIVYHDDEQRQVVSRLIERLRSQPEESDEERPFRVLLVEDNDFAHKLFNHAVKRFHKEWRRGLPLEIVGAKDGREALEVLESTSVDLALVDFFLPVMSGAELIRRMRRDRRLAGTPVLVISVGGAGVREESFAAGADLYLDKPVLLKQLITTLHALLRTSGEGGGRRALALGENAT
jgi:CheY-like chemotaxis protein